MKTAYEELREQERDVRARASEYEQGYVDLLAEIEKLKAQNEEESKMLIASTEAHAVSTENQTIYDLESRLSASEADKQIALQDAERLQQSVDALEGVLHQFQVDQKHQVRASRMRWLAVLCEWMLACSTPILTQPLCARSLCFRESVCWSLKLRWRKPSNRCKNSSSSRAQRSTAMTTVVICSV